jgi:hypothetical protein
MQARLFIWAPLAASVLVLLAWCTSSLPDPKTDTATPSSAEDPLDLLHNKKFLAKAPEYPRTIAQLIERSGFSCPRLAMLTLHGPSPYGDRLEALCGPAGEGGAYPDLHYAVYPDKLKVELCKPFSAFSGECS